MLRLLDAWLRLDIEAICQLLDERDPGVSAIAAFALGTMSHDDGGEHLIRAFHRAPPTSGNDDVAWAITDTIALIDPVRVTKEVVLPLLHEPKRATYLAYLIGRLGIATPDSSEFEFLRRSLESGDNLLVGRALRSYAALLGLQGASAPLAELDALRKCCHELVDGQFDVATQCGLIPCSANLTGHERQLLRYQAFEALRSIGNEQSIEVLRKVRQRAWGTEFDETADPGHASGGEGFGFDSLSFEISEEIYWRLGGGLDAESTTPLGTTGHSH
jgi:HEAT repeat protein